MLLCYVVIGAYWLQHHYSGRIYARSDHGSARSTCCSCWRSWSIPYPIRVWCFHLGTPFEPDASVTLAAGLALTACTWMTKWFYGMPGGRRVMDERLAPDFLQQMTRRYGIATLIQIAAVAVAIAAPRDRRGDRVLCVALFLLPQPTPRYMPGQEPDREEKEEA